MSIKIERAKLENVSIGLKQATAKLKFSMPEKIVLPDEVRDKLSMLERMENLVTLSLVGEGGDVLLELSPCRVSMADIKIGPGRGQVALTTADMRAVWEAREMLKHYLLAEMETLALVMVEQQPMLLSDQLSVSSDQEEPLLDQAVEYVKGLQAVSISMLQRHFLIGYPRAARLMDEMARMGVRVGTDIPENTND